MIFRKKMKMIDIRELQKRGVVRIPQKDIVVPTNNEGFIELGNTNRPILRASSSQSTTTSISPSSNTSPQSNSDLFGFMNNRSSFVTGALTE